MRLSLDWIGDHVDLSGLAPQRAGELFTLHVAEVEEVHLPGGGWPGVTVARVKATRPHPNADRLRLALLETSSGEVEVVCGAPNIAPGQKICFAPVGVTLPGGLTLERRKIRGVESAGMALSGRELGLNDEHEGIIVLGDDVAVGTPVSEVLGGGGVLEIDNTAITSRPDLWGHYGAAREFAAILDRPLRPLDLGGATASALPAGEPAIRVTVKDRKLCPRYLGWAIGGIRIAPSPEWLSRRIEAAGQRPINNVVDLTNYVMLECGQPIHAFDRRQVAQGHIVVRRARKEERVTTLDGQERTLPPGALVIADPERALAIAGVMGLANSEVLEDTTEIILEVANFEMSSIRATSQALHLRTESAMRFEKGLDPEGVATAARRFLKLLGDLCPSARPMGGPCDARVPAARPRKITLPAGWIGRRLGVEFPEGADGAILRRLGFTAERKGRRLEVIVPSFRAGRDVSLPEDLVEEVGRIHGYGRIAPVPLLASLDPVPVEPERAARRRARSVLTDVAGFTEIHTYPFTTAADCEKACIQPGTLAVANAAQPGLDLLATSLLPNLLRAAAESLKYRDEIAMYVAAPVFLKESPEGLPRENERVALCLARRAGADPLLEMKGTVEALLDRFRLRGVRLDQGQPPAWLHPGRGARLARGQESFGWFGQLHPRVAKAFGLDVAAAVADLDLEALRTAPADSGRMEPISRYPTVPFDVAVVVDRRTTAASVEETLRKADRERVRQVVLFDAYEGPNLPAGSRSLAFHVTFGAMDRTLSTAEVDALRAAVESAVARRGWSLRK